MSKFYNDMAAVERIKGSLEAAKEASAEPRKKRKQAALSPTQKTLAWCRKQGWMTGITEHWNAHAGVRQDLFDCIDLIACTPGGIVGIQTTTIANHAARRTKALASDKMAAWCAAGGIFWVVSWGPDPEPRFELVHVPKR